MFYHHTYLNRSLKLTCTKKKKYYLRIFMIGFPNNGAGALGQELRARILGQGLRARA